MSRSSSISRAPSRAATPAVAAAGNAFSLKLNQVDSKNISVENATPVTPIGFSPNGSAENAPIVFAGYGIVSADPKFDDYANLEVRGKVVLIFDGTPEQIQASDKPVVRHFVLGEASEQELAAIRSVDDEPAI